MTTFSLKALFMFTLLFLLIANAINWNLQTQRLTRETFEMSTELSRNQRESVGFEQRKLTYQRAEEAFLKHKAQFEAALPKFQAVVDRYGKLNVEDPGKLYFVDVPTLGTEGFLVKQIRMWAPDKKYRLGVGFRSSARQAMSSLEFGDSKLYVPSAKKLIDLPKGESLVRFEWHELREQRALRGKVFLNDSLVHEFGLKGEVGRGHSSSSTVPVWSQAFRVRKERTLYSLTPSLESEIEEAIGLFLLHDEEKQ